MDITETKIYKHLKEKDNTFYCANINNVVAYAQSFLSRIPAMFSNYTNHDIGHSARVADYMVALLPQPLDKYNDTELVIMLYSAIFHDIGMVVSETEGDLDSARQDDIRKTHHIRTEKFLNGHNEKYDCFNIDNEGSINFKSLVATIARSHGEDFSWIGKNLKQKEYFGNDTVNPQFIACLLRLGDYLDFDSKRTPYHLFNFLNLSTISSDEWKKHFSITNYNKIENQRIFFYGNCEEPDIFLGILHYFNLIEKEIKNAKSLLSNDDEKYKLTIEDKVLNQISHNSFDSVDLQFLMDYISISNLLMGENLYSDKKSALREIIQNSLDAVSLRKEIAEKNEIAYTPEIKIVIEEDKISIQDNGIGMTLSDVKNYFLNIGHSFYRSADFKDLSLTYKPISHYGIGFLSSFLLSDTISVKTTSYKEPQVCNVLQLQKNNRFVIQKSKENALPEAGTEIILAKSSFMKVFPKVEDIRKYISETFKDTGVKIIVSEDGQENAVSFTNQQSKNRIDVSDYLNNVECSCSNPLLSSKKEGIKLYGIQSVLSPFENTGECIYDAEYFSEKIVAFDDLYKCSKKEWALDGDSVFYANADLIQDTLKYDFENEKNFDYSVLTKEQTVNHITRFVANIWQVHPFGEGNTRTTAVFTIMYLRSLGFEVNNAPFEKHSWYFRNALVRANYTNVKKSIYMNNIFLEKFFENLLLGKNNELKNRYTHIRYTENIEKTSVENDKTFGTKEKTSVQIMELMKKNPSITLQQIAEKIGLSKRAIEMQVKKLREQGKVNRIGATKKGLWEVRG